jgi:hypothetical protein
MDLRNLRSPVSAPRYTFQVHVRCRLISIMRNQGYPAMKISALALSLALAAIPPASEAQNASFPVIIGKSAISESIAVTGEAIYAYYDYASMHLTSIDLKWTAQDGPHATPSTLFLGFAVYTPDPASQVCTTDPNYGTNCNYTRIWIESGSGDVPLTDGWFSPNGAGVTTNITRPGFIYDRCLFDSSAYTYTCGLGPASAATEVTVTWNRFSNSPPAPAEARANQDVGNLVECALYGCARPDLYSPITKAVKVRLDQPQSRATGSLLGQSLIDVTGALPAGIGGAATSFVEQQRTVIIDLLP